MPSIQATLAKASISILLHITPKLFSLSQEAELVDLRLEPFGLWLSGRTDLATRRPFRNKGYAVACRRHGRKALNGFFVEVGNTVTEFQVMSRWAVDASFVTSHRVHYRLLDREFDFASPCTPLWHAGSTVCGRFASRLPPGAIEAIPAFDEPKMEVECWQPDRNTAEDRHDALGRIIERRQTFAMPTLESERLLSDIAGELKLPSRGSAYRV